MAPIFYTKKGTSETLPMPSTSRFGVGSKMGWNSSANSLEEAKKKVNEVLGNEYTKVLEKVDKNAGKIYLATLFGGKSRRRRNYKKKTIRKRTKTRRHKKH